MIPALSRSLERESVHKILERMVPSNKNTGIAFELAGQAVPALFYADCQVWEGWLNALYSQSPIASLSPQFLMALYFVIFCVLSYVGDRKMEDRISRCRSRVVIEKSEKLTSITVEEAQTDDLSLTL